MQKLLWIVFLTLPCWLNGQPTAKKVLSSGDYAGWKTISGQKISAGGQLLVFEVNPQQGDGELQVVETASGKTRVVPRGKGAGVAPAGEFVLFRIAQPEDTLRKARLKKVKKEEMPRDSLGLLVTSSGAMIKYPGLKSFSFSEEHPQWVAFTLEPRANRDTTRTGRRGKGPGMTGDDLILYRISTGDTLRFPRVTEFVCPKKGGSVYFISQKKDSLVTWSALHRMDAQTGGISLLFTSPGYMKKLVTDEPGRQYAFLFSTDTADTKVYALYLGGGDAEAPRLIAGPETPGMPAGWSPSENGTLRFSEAGDMLWLATAPTPRQKPKDTIPDEEKPRVDIWNWQDPDLMSQQLKEVEREKKRSYAALWLTGEGKFLQQADSLLPEVMPAGRGKGELALGVYDLPYRRIRSWDREGMADYHLVDLRSGERRLLAKATGRARLSPRGRYLWWYERSDSTIRVLPTGDPQALPRPVTRDLPFPIYNELNDTPGSPGPYGIAGWSSDERYLFLYDRYDIWKTDAEGRETPVCVTSGYGRQNQITLRYLSLDPEEEFIPGNRFSLLSAFDHQTMSAGFYNANLHEAATPRALVMSAHYYGTPLKARNSDRLLWTRESATEFPDVWTSDLSFRKPVKISNANPQQAQFNWLTTELTEWTSFSGEKLQGILYKPGDFDPSRKYPMVVYFYERNAQNLHRHPVPSPSRSTINRAFYASNGYLVFVPDITYRDGFPGQSAYDAIVSGVYALAATRPWVDLSRVGLQGQSWGGYQTAWLITRTGLFAAAMAGAPVSNMTSAYGGIRWESGMSRMAQYEQSQSRIGATLWDKPMHYLENSPLFAAPQITTPLLIMHNDNDGAVPWSQGIEMFMALSRLGKPVWMLNYNGEPHNLKDESWANRMDLDKRMFQFFNHYLKGDPMPEWMERGLPAVRKGESLGY